MEIPGNKYLHKKFKKQTSCPIYNADEASPQTATGSFHNGQNTVENSKKDEKLSEDDSANRLYKNSDSVPNLKSTNCEYIVKDNLKRVNIVDQSSISVLYSLDRIENKFLSKTVSNVISKTDTTVANHDLKENHFNFDIKSSNTNVTDKSSIDIEYSKYKLLLERPNIVNVQSDEPKNFSKNDDHNQEIIEKKCTDSTGGKYVCTYCNLACSKPSVLQKHIRAHTNERPYPCVSCGFSFKTRSNLYKHCRSRTHANRVMGNKHIQDTIEYNDMDSSEKTDKFEICEESQERTKTPVDSLNLIMESNADQINTRDQKSKPYKPKFHTAKIFFEENNKINTVLDDKKSDIENPNKNPDLLKLRINELISKNNSIVNCDDAVFIRRKNLENGYVENSTEYWQHEYSKPDEPLNLTAKNRKRCLSDSENTHTTDKSLIKQLLLKNLSPDPDLQCQYCRMIFQTVPELEMHKLKYCTAYNKGNVRYVRSSSVNVASILTQNKNAFDNIPHMQNSTFPLKSPGPCLGKTRLIENDKAEKYRTFSFDDNAILHHTQPESPSLSKYMIPSPGFSPISPQVKKNPIKLFGGEVKITQTSGETRSFKIESETSMNKMSGEGNNYIDYGTKMSENLVIKSSLQSGGTVLQNKSTYSQKGPSLPSPNILRYDNTNLVSPSLNLPLLSENKFTYDKIPSHDRLLTIATQKSPNIRDSYENTKSYEEKEKELYKSNLIDFSQKAVKLITPNLKAPNLSIPGLPIPMSENYSPIEVEKDKQHLDNINFAKKQISLQQKMTDLPNMYNPVNLLVDGKVIRYVPGMPGPVVEAPMEFPNNVAQKPIRSPKEVLTPRNDDYMYKTSTSNVLTFSTVNGTSKFEVKTPTIVIDQHESPTDVKMQVLSKIKSDYERKRELETNRLESKSTPLSISISSPEKREETKKFIRPNSLALKPSSVAFKQHHGLTPTMFNQALISPDTPRVAKKFCQQYLNGNYFSYLGLKSSTKSVYCTLNKTQPFYVKHFKKLSMYSEWRQQESKIDSLSVSSYDSRQRPSKYTLAGTSKADLIVHSSYKFVISESTSLKDENNAKNNSVLGGYESNEDYTYIRGRGRGRYVCDQCGIRCKKPSMLKKHLRTHSDDRPYTCQHCNFSFKTKGNLTKHMKSKAHSKKYAETNTSTTNSVTTSSESEDSDAESSDESTRLQDHEAAHCLLSLAQKSSPPPQNSPDNYNSTSTSTFNLSEFPMLKDDKFLKNPEQITQVNNTNFAKNKILDETNAGFSAKHLSEGVEIDSYKSQDNMSQYLGRSSTVRPLTYPYQKTFDTDPKPLENNEYPPEHHAKETFSQENVGVIKMVERKLHEKHSPPLVIKKVDNTKDFNLQNLEGNLPTNIVIRKRKLSTVLPVQQKMQRNEETFKPIDLSSTILISDSPVLDLSPASESVINYNGSLGKNDNYYAKSPENKSVIESTLHRPNEINFAQKMRYLNVPNASKSEEPMHINHNFEQKPRNNSFSSTKSEQERYVYYDRLVVSPKPRTSSFSSTTRPFDDHSERQSDFYYSSSKSRHSSFSESNSSESFSQNSDINDRNKPQEENIENPNVIYKSSSDSVASQSEQDQSAMQTLAEIAIKQMKNEKNIMAKSVASEYLKLALKNEYNASESSSDGMKKFVNTNKEGNDLIKPEENKNCSICSKNFSKPSQLRLHMNIHYLERPFRCESCSVSFRTKGHLQKHERSASHHNKLSSSPALSSSEPRPFKCSDCNIAFRIHGHLAKHLRSKMHIMKLECLAKIPFGLYAELERANSLLTEINTTDGDLCLESLKILARKLFNNDPNKLDQLSNVPENRDS